MPRRGWILAAAAVLAGGGAMALFRPRPAGDFPLADLVPPDAVLYAGFPDPRPLEELAALLPRKETAETRRRLESARPHLAGPVALYLDPELRWVFLARLNRVAAALAEGEVEGGVAVIAQSPEALARRRGRKGSLLDVPAFRELKAPVFVNLDPLGLPGRLRDFSALGFTVETGPETVLRGRALYRGESFRTYLEERVHAPRAAGPPAGPSAATFVEPLPRAWDEALSAFAPADRDRAEREAALLSKDFLGGRGVREFLGRLGPLGGVTLTTGPIPALALWVDLPDAAAREKLELILPRLAQDVANHRRGRGLPAPFEVAPEEDRWRVRFPWEADLRMGDAFRPVYAFRGNRWVFATRAEALDPPTAAGGGQHLAASVEVGPLLESLRAFAPAFPERGRIERELDAWRERLERVGRVTGTGRYTGTGLAFELRLGPAPDQD